MKLSRLKFSQRLSKKDWLLTIIPLIGALLLLEARDLIYTPKCSNHPETCQIKNILPVDQFFYPKKVTPNAEKYSDITQSISGIIGFSAPIIIYSGLSILKKIHPAVALTWIATDLLLISQTVLWNSFSNEVIRSIVQRPRPYVYPNPKHHTNPSDYTSFYSGHSSFTMAIAFGLIFCLLGRIKSLSTILFFGLTATSLSVTTGIYRVLSHKHFFTDILFAWLIAIIIAFFIAFIHRSKNMLDR